MNFFLLGKFTISEMDDGQVWIRNEDGEGGSFSAEDLEAAVEQFFWDNF
jgi:hypothetical protein